jgi:hypothetical protein
MAWGRPKSTWANCGRLAGRSLILAEPAAGGGHWRLVAWADGRASVAAGWLGRLPLGKGDFLA